MTKEDPVNKMEIFQAEPQDSAQIIKIWQNSFPDAPKDIDFYMKRRYNHSDCFLIKDEHGLTVSVLQMLPCRIAVKSTVHECRYIYLIATSPEYRGMGLAPQLIEYAVKKATSEGINYLCLLPLHEPLYAYYDRFGFKGRFRRRLVELAIAPENGSKVTMLPNTPEAIAAIRDGFLSHGDYVVWNTHDISFAVDYFEYIGGRVVRFASENREMYALLQRPENGIVRVHEFIGDDFNALCAVAAQCFPDAHGLRIYACANSKAFSHGQLISFGALYAADGEYPDFEGGTGPHLGLTLE